jgi:N-acetylglucosaminyl-diphospho-decaprenol L-rhamnosyltransferase
MDFEDGSGNELGCMTDLGIVIVSWNTRDLLRDCLRSVFASEGVSFDVVVVDNASADGSADMVRDEFPQAILIAGEHNVGYPAGNNIGLLRLGFSEGVRDGVPRYGLLLNPDTILPPDGLRQMVAFMDADPKIGMAGPSTGCWAFPGCFRAASALAATI